MKKNPYKIPEHVEPSKPWPRPAPMNRWEKVNENTNRMRVPGGWIVLHFSIMESSYRVIAESMCFVPDPEQLWKIEE